MTTSAEGILEEAALFVGKVRQVKWFDVYFVDDDGLPIPNAKFETTYANGEKKTCQANINGYYRDDKAIEGEVNIKMKNGEIIESYGDFGDFSDEHADPKNVKEADVEYLIRKGDTLPKIARRLGVAGGWTALYKHAGPDGKTNAKRLRSGSPFRIYPGETIWVPTRRRIVRINTKNAPRATAKVRVRGQQRNKEQRKIAQNWDVYHTRFGRAAVDNLMIVAGWDDSRKTLNIKKLCDALEPCVKIIRPDIGSNWNLYLFQDNLMYYYDSTGSLQHTFKLNASPEGQRGAYSLFEIDTRVVTVAIYDSSACFTHPVLKLQPDRARALSVTDFIDDENEKKKYIDSFEEVDPLIGTHTVKKLPVDYLAPSTAEDLGAIILKGGSGVLDNYIGDDAFNRKAHERNLIVLDTYNDYYKEKLKKYIDDVKAVPASEGEDALREKGRPPEPYQFPMPIGASQKQEEDLIQKMQDCSSYSGWLAVSEKIYEIDCHRWPSSSSQHSEGALYFRPKLTLEPDIVDLINSKLDNIGKSFPYFGRLSSFMHIKGEWNFDIGTDGFKPGKSKSIVFKEDGMLKINKVKLGAGEEIEIDDSGGKKITFKLKAGDYGVECATDGEYKLTGPFGATAYANPKKATGGFGVDLSIPGLGSIYIGIGFDGLKSETVMVYLTGAPGFFERRSCDELVRTAWTNLNYVEVKNLQLLCWDQESWDTKDQMHYSQLPNSVKTDMDSLSPNEYVAALALGFQAQYADNWVTFWRRRLLPVKGAVTFGPQQIHPVYPK